MLCKTLTAALFFRKLFLTEERPHFVLNNKAMSNGRGCGRDCGLLDSGADERAFSGSESVHALL